MKYAKYLFMALIVTTLTSTMGVKASSEDPYTVTNMSIGNFGGYNSTLVVYKTDPYEKQEIKEVKINPTGDYLYVYLQNQSGKDMGAGKRTLKTDKDVDFDNTDAMKEDWYKLKIYSPLHYTKSTLVSFKWWVF